MEERLAVRLRRQLVWWIILAVLFWGFWFLLPIWTYRLARATGSGMGSAVAYAVFSLLFPVNLILWGILCGPESPVVSRGLSNRRKPLGKSPQSSA